MLKILWTLASRPSCQVEKVEQVELNPRLVPVPQEDEPEFQSNGPGACLQAVRELEQEPDVICLGRVLGPVMEWRAAHFRYGCVPWFQAHESLRVT